MSESELQKEPIEEPIESDPFDLTFDLEAQGFPGGDPQKMQK